MMNRRDLLSNTTAIGIAANVPVAAMAEAPGRFRNAVLAGDGTPLFVREWGTGRPVIFTHSLGLSSEIWLRQMLHLAAMGCRCIAYDRRGHGRSGVPADGYDMDTLADDLARVIDGSGARQVVLIGHSMGAGEITRYLARHGTAKVTKIVLVAPTTPCLLASADNQAGLPSDAFNGLDAQWIADFPQWVEDNKRPFFTADTSPALADWLARLMLGTSLPVLLACNRTMVEADHRASLRRIDTPVLIIHGDKDMSAPLDITGRPTAAGIPNARLIVYPDAPHGLFVTHADRLNADLGTFIVTGRVP